MKLTKAMVRDAWEKQPGLGWAGRDGPDGLPCASQALPTNGEEFLMLFISANDSFRPNDGVTPEERRDCVLAMLEAGAFDAWLE